MQFINIVVHSVEEMNYRIFLQHEFKLMGLDDYLEVSVTPSSRCGSVNSAYSITEAENE